MGMMAFHLLFPHEAADECHTVVPVGISDLPRRTFVFMEAYCADPRCECRRVMHAFEPPQPPFDFDDEGQMFLDPLNPQTAMSPAFLQLTADMMARDRAYHDRLVRHDTMWRRVVDDPSHPDQATLQAVRDRGRSPSPSPMRRSWPKIGPNDPCPGGSGRKGDVPLTVDI